MNSHIQGASPLAGTIAVDAGSEKSARLLSQRLKIPFLESINSSKILAEGRFVAEVSSNGLSLAYTGQKQPSAVFVDFTSGSADHRRRFGGGKGQMIAKAVGIKSSYKPSVLDLTAGLGQDAFVMASLGCQMTLLERSPIIYEMLKDGLLRAKACSDSDLKIIIDAMHLYQSDAQFFLSQLATLVDVVYLDPMFPARQKQAKVKKEMQVFHQIVGEDQDAGELLLTALTKAKYRVVVKRPRVAPALHEQYPDIPLPTPGLVLSGKSSRYDIYPLCKIP